MRTINVITGFLAVLSIPLANAGIASRDSVVNLTAAADAIVTGTVDASAVGGSASVTVGVVETLKGALRRGDSVSFVWTPPRGPLPSTWRSKAQGLIFLKQQSNGLWELLPAARGDVSWEDTYLPAAIPQNVLPERRRNAPANLEDIRRVAAASVPHNASPLDKVLLEVVVGLEAGVPIPVDIVSVFHEHRSPVLSASFGRLRSNNHAFLKLIGLRGAVASGDPAALGAVHESYRSLSQENGWSAILQEVRFYYTNSSPEAVQALGTIVVDSNAGSDLRVAAAIALAKIHTKQSLPYLAKLLDDESLSLKAAGVGGMSSYANNVPMGSHEPAAGDWRYRTPETIAHSVFDENAVRQREAFYVGFWQNWWRQNQDSVSK